MVQGLRVLYLSAEATPLVKVGGLGDVAGELPLALRALGLDGLLALPLRPAVNAAGGRIHRTTRTQIPRPRGPLDRIGAGRSTGFEPAAWATTCGGIPRGSSPSTISVSWAPAPRPRSPF